MPEQLVISDSSVLIDLERGSLLSAAFALDVRFCVPDLLYQRELLPYDGERLRALGLNVLALDDEGVREAARYRASDPALSLADAFALALAVRHGAFLLTGDARLRRLAVAERTTCHGLLWLIDRILLAGIAPARELHDSLLAISRHPQCRLPQAEVNRRLVHLADQAARSP